MKRGVLDNLQKVDNGMNRFVTGFSTMLKCDYFPLCSGCQIQGDVTSPPIWHDVKSFFHDIAPHLSLTLKLGQVTNWRTRSKLAVRGTSLLPEIGLFKHGSHEVVSIPTCPLHHPAINALHLKIKKMMIEKKIDPYNEKFGTGIIRYIQCVVERKTGRVQLTLVINGSIQSPSIAEFVQELYDEKEIHSIWLNFQPQKTNRIFSDSWLFCCGELEFLENLGGVECVFHPACFSQAHLELFEEALKQIQEWVIPNRRILELYAGVGVIGLNLVSKASKVVCVEINPCAASCFLLSQMKLPLALQDKISMQITHSERAVSQIDSMDVIIVDPPRKGLDQSVLEAICFAKNPLQLVYLSCGPLSFQRDCKKLMESGWEIERVEGYLFFPGTNHIELLGFFRKNI